MATKKQRRRRNKERRHEYEYVYVDGEGNEVPVEEAEPDAKNGKAPAQRASRTGRGGRTVDPPSWRRTLRRAAMFAPLMFVVLYLLRSEDQPIASVLLSVVMLLAFFVPFSYFMDSLMYRLAQRRAAQQPGSSPKSGSPKS
jgi:hypothetical protein